MSISKEIIKHWAYLCESEEDRCVIQEDTLKGFNIDDIKNSVNVINQRLKETDIECELHGDGGDWSIKLIDKSIAPNYDTEYYSADGYEDYWSEKRTQAIDYAKEIVFDTLESSLYLSRSELEEYFEFIHSGDYVILVPKSKRNKLIADAIRNLVDKEYNTIRKLPLEKRLKYFMTFTIGRFAYMAKENNICNSSRLLSCVDTLMDEAEKVGAYGIDDFIEILGIEATSTTDIFDQGKESIGKDVWHQIVRQFGSSFSLHEDKISFQLNNNEYMFYVLIMDEKDSNWKIESGWEFKEDSLDRAKELIEDGLFTKETLKVVTKRTLNKYSLNPDNDDCWVKQIG